MWVMVSVDRGDGRVWWKSRIVNAWSTSGMWCLVWMRVSEVLWEVMTKGKGGLQDLDLREERRPRVGTDSTNT